jgi:hypothetical protein
MPRGSKKRSCWGGRRSGTGGKRSRRYKLSKKHPIQQAMAASQGQAQGQAGGSLGPLGYTKVGPDMSASGAGAYEIGAVGGNYDQQVSYFDKAYGQSVAAQGPTPFTGGQSGGRRRRKKGGNFGSVISNAVVPFALLGAQNSFGRRRMTRLMRGPQRVVRGTRRFLKVGGTCEKF